MSKNTLFCLVLGLSTVTYSGLHRPPLKLQKKFRKRYNILLSRDQALVPKLSLQSYRVISKNYTPVCDLMLVLTRRVPSTIQRKHKSNVKHTCGLLMYGFMSKVRPNSIFLSIFPPELPVPLNRLNWIVRILGDLSMVNCFKARTFLRQWLQWYLLSPSKASTAVKRFKALVRESARTISKLKSSKGSYVFEQVEHTVHLTCNEPARLVKSTVDLGKTPPNQMHIVTPLAGRSPKT